LGRYYTGTDAEFTSSEIDLDLKRGVGNSGGTPDPVSVFMVHWTVYDTRTSVDNGSMPDGRVDVVLNNNNNPLTLPSDGTAVSATQNGPLTPANNRLSYRLQFVPNANPPAIDTIIFDDITFYYYSTPKIMSWRYEQ
jgi:hypothetical protein